MWEAQSIAGDALFLNETQRDYFRVAHDSEALTSSMFFDLRRYWPV